MSGSLRRFYLAIKFYPDSRNKPLIEAFNTALAVNGYDMCVVARDVEEWGRVSLSPSALMRASFSLIDDCDAVLVCLNEKGVGIGIEAGYAHAQKKPIFVIAKQGSDISTTLKGISKQVLFYQSEDWLPEMLRGLL